MKKMTLFVTVSLNGIVTNMNIRERWQEVISQQKTSPINCAIKGKITYKELTNFQEQFPYSNNENYVFSSDIQHSDTINYINDDPVTFFKALKNNSNDNIYVMAESKLITSLLEEKLIDEVAIYVISEVLTDGEDLFDTTLKGYTLHLLDTGGAGGGTHKMIYKIKYN